MRKDNQVSDRARASLPLQLKESYRWIECGRKEKKSLDDQQVITVFYREEDLYEVFTDAYENNYEVVIRSNHNGALASDLKLTGELSAEKV